MTKRIVLIIIAIGLFQVLTGYEFDVLEMTDSYMRVGFRVPDYTIQNNKTSASSFDKIDIIDAEFTFEENKVSVPYFAHAIGIPEDGNIELRILTKDSKTHNNIKLQGAPSLNLLGDHVEYTEIGRAHV